MNLKHLFVVVLALALAVVPLSADTIYQAEGAALTGGTSIATDHTGYTGTGFVGGFTDANKGAAKASFTVTAAGAGQASLSLRYANGTGSTRSLSLYVNGTKIKQTSLGATANWDSWSTQTETATLNAGSNTVAYQYDTADSGNVNLDSLTVGGVNLAAGKTATANASNGSGSFGPGNAVDGNAGTYWEGAANAYPNTLTVDLGAASTVGQVVLKLNPAWGDRSQTLSVLGSTDNAAYSTLAASASYTFASASSNVVTINFTSASARYVRLNFTANSGSTGAQVAEFEVYGTGTPPPPVTADLVITSVTWTPASPQTGNEVTFSAVLKNQGTTATSAGTHRVGFLVDGTLVNWSNSSTSSLAAGASITLTSNTGSASKATWTATSGTHTVTASADDTGLIAESSESNNTLAASMTVTTPSGTSDLVVTSLTWTPTSITAPSAVTFTAVIKNQGTVATPAVKHGISFTIDGTQVNWADNYTSSLAAGASVTITANGGPVGTATWASTSGTHTVAAFVDDTGLISEGNEANNTLSASLTVTAPAGLTNGLYRIRNFWQSTKYLYEANGQVLYGTPAAGDLTSQWALVDLAGKKALWNASTGNAFTITGTASSNDPLKTSYSDVSTNAQWTVAAGSNAGYYTIQNAAQTSWYVTLEGLKGFAQVYGITPTWGSPQWAFEYVGAVPAKPAAKPDLVVSDITWSPAKPTAGQAVTFSAVVANQGLGSTGGTKIGLDFAVNGTKVTWVANYTAALAAGSSVTLTADAGTAGATWAMAGTAPTITATVDATALIAETNETNNTLSKVLTTATYGASVPYTTFEAESSTYTGTLISGSRTWGQLSSEASGRAAVQLTAANHSVQFNLTAPAQTLVVRYSIPDTADGSAYNAGLSLYIGGVKKSDLVLTNKYSWLYGVWGTEGGNKHWSNNPNATPKNPHRFFDEVSVVLDASYPVGTTIRLVREASNLNFATTASVTVDLAETEALPAQLSMPSNYVALTSYGAVANDGLDDSTAMNNAIAAVTGSGGTKVGVWVPAGSFDFNVGTVGRGWDGSGTRIYLPAGVSVKGAGMWYSVLQGAFAGFHSKGSGTNVADLKVMPYDVLRDDDNGVTAMEGNFSNSTITGVWVEHAKVGVWTTQSWALVPGIPSNVTVTNNRIRDVWADGLNLHYGTSNSLVSNNVFRNSGDDGMAMWSDATLDANNTFQFNTVALPGLANGIAIYGGKDNKVLSNAVYDTIDNGAGISFGTDFTPPSITGTLTISDNLLVRTGSYHHDQSYNIGALWGYWKNSSGKILSPVITISNNQIQNSTYAGIFIEQPSSGATMIFSGNTVTSPGTYGVEIRNSAAGTATFTNNTVTGAPSGNLLNSSSGFTISGSGNNF